MVAAAQNGREAIDFLKRGGIDLVFLDINLPVISGLEVLEYIDAHHADIMSVVVSGYKNFEYARKACALHAADYLLKPLQEKELWALLRRIEAQFSRKDQQNWEQTLRDALFGRRVQELPQTDCHLLMLYLDAGERMDEALAYDADDLWTRLDVPGAVAGAFEGVATWVLDGRTEMEKLVVSFDRRLTDVFSARALHRKLQADGCWLTTLLFTSTFPLSKLRSVYHEVKNYIEKNRLFCHSAFLIDSGGTHSEPAVRPFAAVDEALQGAKARPADTMRALEHLLENAARAPLKFTEVEMMLKHFFHTLCQQSPANLPYWRVEEELGYILHSGFQLPEMKRQIGFLLKKVQGTLPAPAEKQELAVMVEQYLAANFRHEISNKILSEKFGFVPSYISGIFKAKYGMSPGKYVAQLRIQRAQALMRDTDLLMREISQEVGYEDPFYFSKVFKQITGESPTQYMNRIKKGCGG